MTIHKYIRKFLAVLLLAVFALSNTPVRYLHYLFANHADFTNKVVNDSKTPQLSVTGLNCHCESNVVMVPYTSCQVFKIEPPSPSTTEYILPDSYPVIFSRPISFGLRGPPSVA